MSERPTPETDASAWVEIGYNSYVVSASIARKLERERDKAQEDATNYYAKIGELTEERDDALSQIVQAECRAERFCQERDEARDKYDTLAVENMLEVHKLCQERDEAIENLDEEKKFHHRTHSELVLTQCKVLDLTQAIIATLEENRHLADGDDCTLAKLKSVVPDWE